jgi:hypothetical protein
MAVAERAVIGGKSPAEVALELLHLLRAIEGSTTFGSRKAMLDAYAECLQAASGNRSDWEPPKPGFE